MLEAGAVDVEEVQALINTVELAKSHLEAKMELVRPLYFNYIHLIKRTAIGLLHFTVVITRQFIISMTLST